MNVSFYKSKNQILQSKCKREYGFVDVQAHKDLNLCTNDLEFVVGKDVR